MSLHMHILKNHNQLNLKKFESSCYFNLLISNQTHSTTTTGNKTQTESIRKLIENNLQTKDWNIYLCLNCRNYFTNETKFSHNCWNNNVNLNSDKSTHHHHQSNAASNQNYFSPIYLRFNVNKLLISNSKLIIHQQQQQQQNQQTVLENSNKKQEIDLVDDSLNETNKKKIKLDQNEAIKEEEIYLSDSTCSTSSSNTNTQANSPNKN